MPKLTGVLETSLYVADVRKSATFYTILFELEKLVEDEHFCALNIAGRQVLLLFQEGSTQQPSPTAGGTIPPHGGHGQLHLAFAIDHDQLAAWERQLDDLGLNIESKIVWPRGSTSLYFRDPDGHLIELATPGLWAIY